MSYQIDSRPGEPFCRLQSSYSLENLLGPFDEVKEHVFTVKCVISTSEGILIFKIINIHVSSHFVAVELLLSS